MRRERVIFLMQTQQICANNIRQKGWTMYNKYKKVSGEVFGETLSNML